MNDYFEAIVFLYLLGLVISFVVACRQPVLTVLAAAVITSSSVILVFVMLVQIGTGWHDDIASLYALLLSLLVAGLGMKFLVARERNTVIE